MGTVREFKEAQKEARQRDKIRKYCEKKAIRGYKKAKDSWAKIEAMPEGPEKDAAANSRLQEEKSRSKGQKMQLVVLFYENQFVQLPA